MSLKPRESVVNTDRDANDDTGCAQALVSSELRRCEPPVRGLEFEREHLTAMNDDQIGDARQNAQRLEDRTLNRAAITAVRHSKSECTGRATQLQVFDDRTLDGGFRLC